MANSDSCDNILRVCHRIAATFLGDLYCKGAFSVFLNCNRRWVSQNVAVIHSYSLFIFINSGSGDCVDYFPCIRILCLQIIIDSPCNQSQGSQSACCLESMHLKTRALKPSEKSIGECGQPCRKKNRRDDWRNLIGVL